MTLFPWIFPKRLPPPLAGRAAAWRALSAENPTNTIDTSRYIVVDVETSGLDLRRDQLISVGAVEVRHGKLALGRGFHGILRQDRGSSRENVLVHGIGYTQQSTGDPPAALLMDFLDYAEKLPLIAFHAPFDQGFLQRAVRRHLGLRFSNPFLDLPWLLPGLFGATQGKPRGLDEWMGRFGLSIPNRHSADADALAAAELFLIAVPVARRRGLESFQQLSAFARREEQVARMGLPGIL